jgi:hypothetical protein
MQNRFDCKFNADTGNLDLSFLDADPAMSRAILGWYMSDLREKLRAEEVRRSRAAMESLRTEARRSDDPFLQAQLYNLSAVQMQNLKMAEAESDFAFKVIQSAVVPNKPYGPRPMLDAAIVGLAGVLAASLWILLGAPLEQPDIDRVLAPERARHREAEPQSFADENRPNVLDDGPVAVQKSR